MVIADTVIDLVDTIGRHILDNFMPDRRLRPGQSTQLQGHISINILVGGDPLTTRPNA